MTEAAPQIATDASHLEADRLVALVRGRLATADRDAARAHLDECEACRRLVAEVARATLAGAGGPVEPPDVEDRYVVLEPLGRGGMGVVHRVRPRGGGPALALKSLRTHGDAEARARFLQEAHVASSVHHPNVVHVVDSGHAPDGSIYMVMELLDGEDLRRRVSRETRLAPAEAVRIACGAAAGLGALHAAGYVHRDVKPGNVYLCRDGTVKVLDFGLAVQPAGAGPRLTVANAVVGTPAYMAVEQAKGLGDEDARTDVWGLGATLYDSLCGRTPFEAPSSIEQLLRIVSEAPDPLPDYVPAWLRAVVLRCLAKERSHRPASMQELVKYLERGAGADEVPTQVLSRRELEDASTATITTPSAALAQESRIVTVLLAEGLRDRTAFVAEVKAADGEAIDLVGGRAIGVFGAERWAGDEPERAVRAALTLRALDVARALGVGTGRALRSGRGAFVGAAVVGARDALAADYVGVDPETARRVRDVLRIEAGRVTGPVASEHVTLSGSTGIYGRDRELSELEAELRDVIDGSRASGVLLLGPPGIGKTRLCLGLRDRVASLESPVRWLVARAEPHRTAVAWHAISGAIRRHLALPEGTAPEEVQRVIAIACRELAPIDAALVSELCGSPFPETPELRAVRSDPLLSRDRTLRAVCQLFAAWSESTALVLLLEDAHWADSASLEVVDLAMRVLEARPFFVLATSRDDVPALPPELRRVELRRLSAKAVRQIVEVVLGPTVHAQADAVLARADGNPFFAIELARALAEGAVSTPLSVEAAIQARIDTLPRDERELLRRAAVVGERFWQEALVGAHRDVADGLGQLRKRDLVVPEAQSRLAAATEWRFRHALVRDVAYLSIPEEQRLPLHADAARWLASRPDAQAVEVARRLDEAGAFEEALPFWVAAAEQARQEGQVEALIEAATRALERLPPGSTAFRMRFLRAESVWFFQGELGDAAERDLDLAAELATTPHERAVVTELRARYLVYGGRAGEALTVVDASLAEQPVDPALLSMRAQALGWLGRSDEADAVLEQAQRAAEATGDVAAIAVAVNMRAVAAQLAGRFTEALELSDRAQALFEGTGDFRAIFSVSNRAGSLLALGLHDQARGVIDALTASARHIGMRVLEAHAQILRSVLERALGNGEAALESATQARRVSKNVARNTRDALLAQAAALELLGRSEEALELLGDPLLGVSPMYRAMRDALGARSLLSLGRRHEARATAARGLAERRAANAMLRYERDLFRAAIDAEVPDAVGEAARVFERAASLIRDPSHRAAFCHGLPLTPSPE